MKVLVYGAQSFLGIHIIERFYKENYRVVGIYNDKAPRFSANIPHSKYVCTSTDRIRNVFKAENPDVVIYAKTEKVHTLQEAQRKIDEVTALADCSFSYHTGKFIYLSGVDVYNENSTNENEAPMPAELNARTHLLCEQCLFCFRTESDFSNVSLRLCDTCGYYETLENTSMVYNMINEAVKSGRITTGVYKNHVLLSAGDAVDAVVRSISDNVNGIYNITPKNITPGHVIANEIYREMSIDNSVSSFDDSFATAKNAPLPSHGKASAEMGYISLTQTIPLIADSCSWYKKITAVIDKSSREKKRKTHLIFQVIESIAVFLLFAFITLQQENPAGLLSVNLLTLYIILTSTYFGISHGIFSAILVSGFNIFFSMSNGYSLTATLYNVNVLASIVQNLVIAMGIGYVVERKDFTIEEKEVKIERQKNEMIYLKQINSDLGNIKIEHERRLLKYEYGFGRIYAAIKNLSVLSPNQVFFNTLTAIRDLIEEKNISLYIVQPHSGYIRQFVYIGDKPKKFPKSFRFSDNEEIADIINNNNFYTNNYLNSEMPSAIIPISVDGSVVALVMIENMGFDKLTQYYINILRVTSNLLNDTYSNANIYASLASKFSYEPDSNILTKEEFENAVSLAKKATETSGFEYCLIKLSSASAISDTELAAIAGKHSRSIDEIGRLPDSGIGILLFSTSRNDAKVVMGRLSELKIQSEILDI